MSGMTVGLGIKIPFPGKVDENISASHDCKQLHLAESESRSMKVADSWSDLSGTTRGLQSTLRSTSSMRGLLLAEVGEAMVELDIGGVEGSGFRQGQRIAVYGGISPGEGNSRPENLPQTMEDATLSRHGTLLSAGANLGRNAAELKSILGNSSARLKSGATLLPGSGQSFHGEERTVLEQAKSRARVELDIILGSKICVQGGYMQGHIKVTVRSPTSKESPVLISDGKVRVIGFECISNENDRYPFYQCSALLSTVTTTSESLYGYPYDAEGFAPAIEGVHALAFSMHLPMTTEHDVPKGVFHTQTGVAVRYIAMVSMKVKDSVTGKRSIAHFYRNCEVWPRLNPAVILAPASKPLRMTTSKCLFRGGTGKVNLTASLHRLYWIAGQQCCVKVDVMNATKKSINVLTLNLVRSTVVFKPDPRLEAFNDLHNIDPDACQTSTTQKVVAESVLELGQRGAPGHASAKGWWTGVCPGEKMEFYHSIQLPSDALSIPRSRLLEVDYSLRVTLSAGTLRTADVQVTIPVRIVNFLSVDPPPSFPLTSKQDHDDRAIAPAPSAGQLQHNSHSRSRLVGLFGSYRTTSRPLESLAEASDDSLPLQSGSPHNDDALGDEIAENPSDNSESDGEHPIDDTDEDSRYDDTLEPYDDLGSLSMYEDDTDEVVQHALSLAKVDEFEHAPRFADLYYASVQEGLQQMAHESTPGRSGEQASEHEDSHSNPSSRQQSPNLRPKQPENHLDLRPNARRPIGLSRPNRPRGPSSFAQRVQEKQEARGNSESASINRTSSDEGDEGPHAVHESCVKTLIDPTDSQDHSCISSQESPHSQEVQRGNSSRSQASLKAPKLAEPGSSDSHCAPHEPPILNSTTSAFTNVNGSRLLPRPPPMTNFPPPAPAPEVIPASPSDSAALPIHNYASRWPDPTQPLCQNYSGSSDDDVRVAGSTAARPRLRPQSGSGESACSVKDKIRELEERVKAAEQL